MTFSERKKILALFYSFIQYVKTYSEAHPTIVNLINGTQNYNTLICICFPNQKQKLP